jgi:hypothetical protein
VSRHVVIVLTFVAVPAGLGMGLGMRLGMGLGMRLGMRLALDGLADGSQLTVGFREDAVHTVVAGDVGHGADLGLYATEAGATLCVGAALTVGPGGTIALALPSGGHGGRNVALAFDIAEVGIRPRHGRDVTVAFDITDRGGPAGAVDEAIKHTPEVGGTAVFVAHTGSGHAHHVARLAGRNEVPIGVVANVGLCAGPWLHGADHAGAAISVRGTFSLDGRSRWHDRRGAADGELLVGQG